MRKILQSLTNMSYEELHTQSLHGVPYSDLEREKLFSLSVQCEQHIEERLVQLGAIGRALFVASNDESSGVFTMSDAGIIGLFIESEAATITELLDLHYSTATKSSQSTKGE